ncbi:conserved hypothetical protein [Ricinus communis]|uniref:Uncharacterized protein n=1 Tax=Ricinus communis TaxID=3988 RepID=B9TGH8_RICCO|nr:conserved hypothetical protein [Ricinus communis]
MAAADERNRLNHVAPFSVVDLSPVTASLSVPVQSDACVVCLSARYRPLRRRALFAECVPECRTDAPTRRFRRENGRSRKGSASEGRSGLGGPVGFSSMAAVRYVSQVPPASALSGSAGPYLFLHGLENSVGTVAILSNRLKCSLVFTSVRRIARMLNKPLI